MSRIVELKQAFRGLSAAELESIADWVEGELEEARYRTFHVREAQPEYESEDLLFMTWEEYLTLWSVIPSSSWRSCRNPRWGYDRVMRHREDQV